MTDVAFSTLQSAEQEIPMDPTTQTRPQAQARLQRTHGVQVPNRCGSRARSCMRHGMAARFSQSQGNPI